MGCLINPFMFAAPPGDLDFSLVDSDVSNSTTFAMNFGAADPGRRLVIALGASHSSGLVRTLTNITIGGVTVSSLLMSSASGSSTAYAVIGIAHVPLGTSGNIVITGNTDRFAGSLYRLVNLQSDTPYDTGSLTSTVSVGPIPLDIPAGGVAIGVAARFNGTPFTMSGLISDYTVVHDPLDLVTGAKESVAGETVNFDVSVNSSGMRLMGATFL